MTLGKAKDLHVVTCTGGGHHNFARELKRTLDDLTNREVVSVSVTNIDASLLIMGTIIYKQQPGN